MKRQRDEQVTPRADPLLLLLASVLFVGFSATLKFASLQAHEVFTRRLATVGTGRWSVEQVEQVTLALGRISPGSGGCLPAALVGIAVSRERTHLRIGVRTDVSRFAAHAWLETADGRLISAGASPEEFEQLTEE